MDAALEAVLMLPSRELPALQNRLTAKYTSVMTGVVRRAPAIGMNCARYRWRLFATGIDGYAAAPEV